MFADPVTGPKGLFLGGSAFQLVVQAISTICLTAWAGIATLVIIFVVDKITPIRLSPEDEITGCDYTEHFQGYNIDDPKTLSPLDKILSIPGNFPPQITHRVSMGAIERGVKDFDNFGRRKPYHNNYAFDDRI